MARKGYTKDEKEVLVRQIVELRKKGLAFHEIGEKVRLHTSTCSQWYNAAQVGVKLVDNSRLETLESENKMLRELLSQYLIEEKLDARSR